MPPAFRRQEVGSPAARVTESRSAALLATQCADGIASAVIRLALNSAFCGRSSLSIRLEWEAVFLGALNEGELPSWRSREDDTIDEERRLFYVGLTRAKRILELSTNGTRVPSRFLEEVKTPPPKEKRPPERAGKRGASAVAYEPLKPRRHPNSWNPFKAK